MEEPTTYTIASKKGAYKGWSIGYEECYFFKENPDGKWFPVDNLYGLKYELGYEYVVEGRLLTGEEQFKQNMSRSDLRRGYRRSCRRTVGLHWR